MAEAVFTWDERAAGQYRFAAARALTRTAALARTTVTATLPARFDRPTRFTQSGIAYLPANKKTLTATVLVKDRQWDYLALQETGGSRTPKRGSPITVPVGYKVNKFGNIPRGGIRRQRQRPDTFVATRGATETAHLPPGLYRRPRRKGQVAPTLLVAFDARADYKPRFGFEREVMEVARANWAALMRESMAQALATAQRPVMEWTARIV